MLTVLYSSGRMFKVDMDSGKVGAVALTGHLDALLAGDTFVRTFELRRF
ncbi:hypothetical protein [Amycolatopsis decaplanina]|nr:hypothetical protein [Amycolatopsis decaplanina]